ncbi:hypothetical protein Cni_G01513 [Canna indica]|uniref:Uncharacterized protein n=1 Tax=Canna indica TaxID=4628 RepID=A0AAQ3JNC9_9LILI|nr:hypothetical protein Cni_G01513 [Canna indica]
MQPSPFTSPSSSSSFPPSISSAELSNSMSGMRSARSSLPRTTPTYLYNHWASKNRFQIGDNLWDIREMIVKVLSHPELSRYVLN